LCAAQAWSWTKTGTTKSRKIEMADRSFLELWGQMSRPAKGRQTIRPVAGTDNVLLSKDSDGTFGIVLHGVKDDFRNPNLANLEFKSDPAMNQTIAGQTRRLTDCLNLRASNSLDPVMLSLVMEHLLKSSDKRNFTAEDLSETIDEVIKLTKRSSRPPTKEEIVGAWGEIYLLLQLVSECSDHDKQVKVIGGWEGVRRQIIDFTIPDLALAIEVKTCSDGVRAHHIRGYNQITIPTGCQTGLLASLSVVDNDEGLTCSSLVSSIRSSLLGSREERDKANSLLDQRLLIRGPECNDDVVFLWLEDDSEPYRSFHFRDVPRPPMEDHVSEVEWVAELAQARELEEDEIQEALSPLREEEALR